MHILFNNFYVKFSAQDKNLDLKSRFLIASIIFKHFFRTQTPGPQNYKHHSYRLKCLLRAAEEQVKVPELQSDPLAGLPMEQVLACHSFGVYARVCGRKYDALPFVFGVYDERARTDRRRCTQLECSCNATMILLRRLRSTDD